MRIGILKEDPEKESRIPFTPQSLNKFADLGAEFLIQKNLGESIHIADEEYKEAGDKVEVGIVDSLDMVLKNGEILVKMRTPDPAMIEKMSENSIVISYLDPFNQKEIMELLLKKKLNVFSLEMIPRSTIAQKMDVLSSQANLGGYVAVLLGAQHLIQILPMMTTPAGTIKPSQVFVIGAGVAGLQAIATARRMGAKVEAFDTRPVVEEQVQSLGAKFVKIDLGETGQTKDGYAKALTEEQIRKQQEGMSRHIAKADLVITTAQLFGRPAPRIVTKEMLSGMKPGSVVVDMAVESGGNVEGSRLNTIVEEKGVKIIGFANLPGRVPVHASQVFSANIANLLLHFWDREEKKFNLNLEDDIAKSALITYNGEIFSETYKALIKG